MISLLKTDKFRHTIDEDNETYGNMTPERVEQFKKIRSTLPVICINSMNGPDAFAWIKLSMEYPVIKLSSSHQHPLKENDLLYVLDNVMKSGWMWCIPDSYYIGRLRSTSVLNLFLQHSIETGREFPLPLMIHPFLPIDWWLDYSRNTGRVIKVDYDTFEEFYPSDILEKIIIYSKETRQEMSMILWLERGGITYDNMKEFDTRFALASKYDLKYTIFEPDLKHEYNFIEYATTPEALDWCVKISKQLGRPLRYTSNVMDNIQSIECLNWWKKKAIEYNLEIKYSEKAVDACKDLKSLLWWYDFTKKIKSEFKYSEKSMEYAHIYDTFDMWIKFSKRTGIPIKYPSIDKICLVSSLDKWLAFSIESGLPLKYSSHSLDFAIYHRNCVNGCIRKTACPGANESNNIINWWKNVNETHNLELKNTLPLNI